MSSLTERTLEAKAQLWADFLLFIKVFFPIITGREFVMPTPIGREPHFITISKKLRDVAWLKLPSLLINMPPGYGKSTLVSYWVAWTLSRWPDSQYLYISYGKHLATKHTEVIRRIISCREYRELFEIEIKEDSSAKDSFQVKQGGSIKAFGSAGAITGQDAGLPNLDRFSGAVIIDDPHKPDEVHSDTIRDGVINNYRETILQRPRGPNVTILFIGQCLHEADLAAYLKSGEDERKWEQCILKALDDAGNALYPEINSLENLLEKKEKNPYVFASQFQQDPIPSGGALFRESYFPILDNEPDILLTFITADTAETDKTYNDATVFSFWGLYKIKEAGFETGQVGLHWLDTMETRIEPKDLRNEFMTFYQGCMHHKVKPLIAAIEKKSTGVTLVSVLEDVRGLRIIDIERNRASGSKTNRFLEIQPILAAKMVSFTHGARHIDLCIKHMMKITANNSHRFDDICFIKGTKIATLFGYKNIEDIEKNDLVFTPLGLGKVTQCEYTGKYKTILKRNLEGTFNHPIFGGDKFISLDTLSDDIQLDIISFRGLLRWRYRKLLYLMESNINLWERKDIIFLNQIIIKKEKVLKDFMWQFGNLIINKKFKKGMLFIIRMVIILIMTFLTWNIFLISNICKSIKNKKLNMGNLLKIESIYKKLEQKPQCGIKVKKEECGIEKMQKIRFIKLLKKKMEYVRIVIKNLFIKSPEKLNHVAQHVEQHCIEKILETSSQIAKIAESNLLLKNNIHNPKTEKLAPIHVELKEKEVYNLTVDRYGVYYANKILVSNCDTVADACKLALIDKVIKVHDAHDVQRDSVLDKMSAHYTKVQNARNPLTWR